MKTLKAKKDAATLAKAPVMPVVATGAVALSTLAFGDVFYQATDAGEVCYEVVNMSGVGSPGAGKVAVVSVCDGELYVFDGTLLVVACVHCCCPDTWTITPPAGTTIDDGSAKKPPVAPV